MPLDNAPEEAAALRPGWTSYREFVADREDLMRHKWLMSERAGHDVGLESALLEWVELYRVPMRKQRPK